jgi:hypothetical protein
MLRMHVALLVELKGHSRHGLLVHKDLDLAVLVGESVGTEADQKRG